MNSKQFISGPMTPTANLCINKSRLKVYKNAGDMPTYYLKKGQEFVIEIFNPTQDVILAKINLNGKSLSQGGLVLNPVQRVYLDRYLDVAKKFLFDTYEVDGSAEAKQAIIKNGDFSVEFYKELTYSNPILLTNLGSYTTTGGCFGGPSYTPISSTLTGSDTSYRSFTTQASGNYSRAEGFSTTSLSNVTDGTSVTNYSSNVHDGSATLDWMAPEMDRTLDLPKPTLTRSRGIAKKSKSIETGRVDKGSDSKQTIKTVHKNFSSYAFHNVEYKLLPISQKINTVEDINVKQYCTSCGGKFGKTDVFCAKCGRKK